MFTALVNSDLKVIDLVARALELKFSETPLIEEKPNYASILMSKEGRDFEDMNRIRTFAQGVVAGIKVAEESEA